MVIRRRISERNDAALDIRVDAALLAPTLRLVTVENFHKGARVVKVIELVQVVPIRGSGSAKAAEAAAVETAAMIAQSCSVSQRDRRPSSASEALKMVADSPGCHCDLLL